jgi:hypothetical protein
MHAAVSMSISVPTLLNCVVSCGLPAQSCKNTRGGGGGGGGGNYGKDQHSVANEHVQYAVG